MVVGLEQNSWALGCGVCVYGLIDAPDIDATRDVWKQRSAQAAMGELVFCGCKAGQLYRKALTGIDVGGDDGMFQPTVHWEGD